MVEYNNYFLYLDFSIQSSTFYIFNKLQRLPAFFRFGVVSRFAPRV